LSQHANRRMKVGSKKRASLDGGCGSERWGGLNGERRVDVSVLKGFGSEKWTLEGGGGSSGGVVSVTCQKKKL